MNRRFMSTYERINPFKSVPFWIFWIGMGVIAFINSEVIVYAYDEDGLMPFFLLRLILAIDFAGFPITIVLLSRGFVRTMQAVSPIMWDDASDFESWLEKRQKRIFTLQSRYSKVTAFLIGISVTTSFVLSGIPLQNPVSIVYFLIAGTLFTFIGGQTAYIILDLLVTLAELVKRDIRVPFFRIPHPAITRLQNYYASVALIMTAGYLSLVIAGWQSPYGLFNASVIAWLSILAFFPLTLFILSILQIHLLVSKIKDAQLDMANKLVQNLVQRAGNNLDVKTYEQLEKAMTIQSMVQDMPEWPISFATIFSFLITAGTALIQIVLPLLEVFNP